MADGQTVAFVVFGGALVAAGVKMVFQSIKVARSMEWATTTGKIILSEMSFSRSTGGEIGGGSYVPRVEYEYRAGGRIHRGSTISLIGMQGSSDKSWAQRVLVRYPRDEIVMVHYDPDNPSDSCLENKTGANNIVLGAVAAALLVLAGLAMMLFGAGIL